MFRIAGLHNVRPLIEKMPISEANEAVEKLTNGKVRYRCVFAKWLIPLSHGWPAPKASQIADEKLMSMAS